MVSEIGLRIERPLARYRCFETLELDQARELVGQHFCSHFLDLGSREGVFHACKNRVQGSRVSLNYLRYGAEVIIEPGELTNFFLVQIPLVGQAEVENGRTRVISNPGIATILNPDLQTRMRWSSDCEQILVQIDRAYVLDIARQVTGLGNVEALRFDPALDLTRPGLGNWIRQVRALFDAAGAGEVFLAPDSEQHRVLEESVVAGLVMAQPSSVSALLDMPVGDVPPAVFRRAVRCISECFTDPITLIDIARWANTTPRTLQFAFKREIGVSPMQYVRELRLGYARHLLLTGKDGLSVGDIAELSGHCHFGRFSTAYKSRFGESPSETIRGSRFT